MGLARTDGGDATFFIRLLLADLGSELCVRVEMLPRVDGERDKLAVGASKDLIDFRDRDKVIGKDGGRCSLSRNSRINVNIVS